MAETIVGNEKLRISCNAINIPGSQKNYLACALSKKKEDGIENSLYFKIYPDSLVISNHLDKVGKAISLGEFGW